MIDFNFNFPSQTFVLKNPSDGSAVEFKMNTFGAAMSNEITWIQSAKKVNDKWICTLPDGWGFQESKDIPHTITISNRRNIKEQEIVLQEPFGVVAINTFQPLHKDDN